MANNTTTTILEGPFGDDMTLHNSSVMTINSDSDPIEDYDTSYSSHQEMIDYTCFETYYSLHSSEAKPNLTSFIVYGVLLTLVGLLGLFGNLISIIILSRPKMRSSINCCLLALTSFDLIIVTTSMLMFGLPAISKYTKTLDWYSVGVFQRITPFVYPLALIARTGSVYLTINVTMERYIAVCHPLKARSLCTYGRARIFVICVSLFAILYNIPRFWEVSYETCHVTEEEWFPVVVPSPLRMDSSYIQVYVTWMYLCVMYLVPFLSLTIFNFCIYKEVRAANRERQLMSQQQRKEIGLAVMLLVVVFVFFICNLLALIINAMEVVNAYHVMDEITIISNLLVTVNSSVNFIIYCIFGQKFRKVFLKMFCARFSKIAGSGSRLPNQNSSAYAESRTPTNGKTQSFSLSTRSTVCLSTGTGGGKARVLNQPQQNHHQRQGFLWKTSPYTSIPPGNSTASDSIYLPTSTSQSLLPQRMPSENVQVI